MPPKTRTPRTGRGARPDLLALRPTRLRLLRTHDLVDLQLAFHGVTMRTRRGERRLTTGDDPGILVVTLPPQHIGEEAFEDGLDVPAPTTQAGLRIAEPSRLAYDLPAGLDVALSASAILELIPTLRLRTVPLATPAGTRARTPGRRRRATGLSAVERLTVDRAALVRTLIGDDAAPATASMPRMSPAAAAVHEAARLTRLTRHRAFADLLRPIDPILVDPAILLRGIPRQPEPLETSIEAPWRLVVSPSSEHGAFRHAVEPVVAPDDPGRTELWRTTLTSRVVDDGELVGLDDADPSQRVVRAVWARDIDPATPPQPFLSSLDGPHRRAIVRMTAQTSEGITPQPLQVRRLALSSLGAFIDWRADWGDTWQEYRPQQGLPLLESYTHQAAMGRDTYVRVTQPGFLFPFGHRAVWVTLTERKIAPGEPAVAYLRQRYFIVLREQTRAYGGRDTPLGQVTLSPTTTPDLDRPPGLPPTSITLTDAFVPQRGGAPFLWDLDGVDAAGGPVPLSAPLLFVPASVLPSLTDGQISSKYVPISSIPAGGRSIAMAPSATQGDTAFETASLTFDGEIDRTEIRSRPYLQRANAVIPAMRHLAPASPTVVVRYTQPYLTHGFGGGNPAQMFLGLVGQAPVDFSDGSDRAGGFVEPNLQVRGLSRILGAVGEDGTGPSGLSQGQFDPQAFLAGAMPKLFGLFSLLEILDAVGLDLDLAPDFVTEALDAVSSIASEAQRLHDALDGGVERLAQDLATAAHDGARAQVQQALDQLEAAAAPMLTAIDDLLAALAALVGAPASAADVVAKVTTVVGAVQAVLDAAAHPMLPAAVRAAIQRPADALRAIATDPAVDLLTTLAQFADNLLSPSGSMTARYEWRPRIASWPGTGDDAVFVANDPRGLSIGVEVRASAQGAPSADVVAELRDFALQLLPGEPLMRMNFSRIGFRVGTGRKPEVDVVFDGMEFLGVLGFIDTLREIIPFDGFADPPYVDVAPDGITAGFDLALPNVAIGVFSLENISLGADARVPFLGDAVTVGFYFCRKDSPFRLTVLCIGGGGWVGLRASPAGLVELEMGLEAAASLSIDLGVASGSVSIAVGVYLRLEGDAGSLTAYFRIRGEVDVLGLISASITLELSLTYDFPTGKLIGRASIVVEVEVLFFSASVEVSCERKLAGSNGDPTLADIMPPGAGGDEAWARYCTAFAAV